MILLRLPIAALTWRKGFEKTVFHLYAKSASHRLAITILAIQNTASIHMDPREQRKNLERFGELVLANRWLHDQLRATTDTEAFAELAVRLGAEREYAFSPETVREAIIERRRAWLEWWVH